ncbi:2444_t:CDS:2 [Entrophospora sp. SA101]|nr:2444_t:CDS:2 [Entrophospora sp. SA101]
MPPVITEYFVLVENNIENPKSSALPPSPSPSTTIDKPKQTTKSADVNQSPPATDPPGQSKNSPDSASPLPPQPQPPPSTTTPNQPQTPSTTTPNQPQTPSPTTPGQPQTPSPTTSGQPPQQSPTAPDQPQTPSPTAPDQPQIPSPATSNQPQPQPQPTNTAVNPPATTPVSPSPNTPPNTPFVMYKKNQYVLLLICIPLILIVFFGSPCTSSPDTKENEQASCNALLNNPKTNNIPNINNNGTLEEEKSHHDQKQGQEVLNNVEILVKPFVLAFQLLCRKMEDEATATTSRIQEEENKKKYEKLRRRIAALAELKAKNGGRLPDEFIAKYRKATSGYSSGAAQTLILPMLAPQTTSPIPSSSTTDSEILELVEILLKRGASPNDPNSYPLTKSCQINNLDMVKLLLKYKADPTIISLQIAIKYNNEPLINLLIESGIKIDNKLITFAESKASVFPQTIELLKTLQLKQLKN